jgi:2,4-dienoyl-CoA reductase-like NADH-dependent reductase (Old Yellow Enzyme family)/thioredoxin reductase
VLSRLFEPLALGPVTLPGRIASTSHQTTLVEHHLPTEDFIAYQAARARGGAALIILEAVAVAPSGLLTAHTLAGYERAMLDGYRRVQAAVAPHGCRLFVQLFHGGREVIASVPRPEIVSASARPSQRFQTEPRALSTIEVEELIAGYGRCAELASAAGLDGIELSAAHGYLAEQFFDPALNDREDRFGDPGSFLLEALRVVRDHAPTLALGVRLSADSAPARAVVAELTGLVDYVHLAVGNSATVARCAGIVPPPPAPRNLIGALTAPFRIGVPLLATTRIVEPADAAALLERGDADAVGMTRALIADPQMPAKARAGATDEIRRCIGCNACIAHYHAGTPIRCAVNPRTGRERRLGPPEPAAEPGRVVVVGAGPAGLFAAGEAAAAGHEVILLERGERIGGQVALAGRAPAHRELAETLLGDCERVLERAGVEVRLGAAADVETVAALVPSRVVLATGARPFTPDLSLRDVEVLQAFDVLAGARPAGGPVLIADLGADAVALDCAELLAAEGRAVTVVAAAPAAGQRLHQYERNGYMARLARAGVAVVAGQELAAAGGGTVRLRNIYAPELQTELPAASLVLALGRVPDDALAAELAERGIAFVPAGDCRSPRGLEEAILEGTLSVASSRILRGYGDGSSEAEAARVGDGAAGDRLDATRGAGRPGGDRAGAPAREP